MEKVKKKIRWRRSIFIYGGLLWAVAHFAVFFIGMNVSTVINSFFRLTVRGEMRFAGWDAYREVFRYMFGGKQNGMVSGRMFINNLSLVALALCINLPVTLVFSYMIFKKIRGNAVLRVMLYMPCVVSVIILCLFFRIMVSGSATYKNLFTVLEKLGYSNKYVIQNGVLNDRKTAWGAILIFSVWTGVNGNIIYFCSAMARLPQSVTESAKLDGASDFRQFFQIVIPMIWPVITTMSITLIGGCISWYIPAQIIIGSENIAGSTGTSTVAWVIVNQVTGGATVGFPAALGIVVGIIGSGFVLLFKFVMEKIYTEVEY